MSALGDLVSEDYFKLLLCGDSSTGKTCSVGTAPGKIHIFDFDKKLSSLIIHLQKTNKDKIKDITFDTYTEGKVKGKAGQKFVDDMNKLIAIGEKGGEFPYDTVCLDSITTLNDAILHYIVYTNPGLKRTVTSAAIIPALQDYQLLRMVMKDLIKQVLALPCNVIFTSHIERIKDETTGRLIQVPMMQGKLATELPIYFSEIYKPEIIDGKYMAITQSTKEFKCRTELGLPKHVPMDWSKLKSK